MSALASVRAWGRAMPTLLRVGAAETLAYRAEFFVWMLTTTLPLVMLGLWTTVADEAPFGRFGRDEFVAYYLATLIVRNVTGTWVVWQINNEVRTGTLSMRLLRPIHPFVGFAATHLSAVPLRALIAVPVTVILLVSRARGLLVHDPALLGLFAVSLIGAWALTFFLLVGIGALSFFLEKSMALFDVYLGVFAVLSGYLIPLELLPGWVQTLSDRLPFRYMLAYPVELLIGSYDHHHALRQLGYQWLWVIAIFTGTLALWRAGVRRFEAYGS